MKKNLLMTVAAMTMLMAAPTVLNAEDADGVKALNPVADTYLRMGNSGDNSAKEQMEIGTSTSKNTDFVGLLKFNLDADVVGNVKKATLRIVSERVKGNPVIGVYAYNGEWEENAVYVDQADNIAAARAIEAVATFTPKGIKGRSILSDKQDDVSTNIADWTNEIDVTDYVSGLTGTTLSFMIAETNNQSDNQKYFTREAQSFSPAKDPSVTIAAVDIVPLLTIEYAVSTGITDINSDAAAKAQAIYTLQGVRVKNMDAPGIYIVGGKKIVKR